MKITGTYVCIVFDVEMCLVVDSQVSGLPQRMYQIDLTFLIWSAEELLETWHQKTLKLGKMVSESFWSDQIY